MSSFSIKAAALNYPTPIAGRHNVPMGKSTFISGHSPVRVRTSGPSAVSRTVSSDLVPVMEFPLLGKPLHGVLLNGPVYHLTHRDQRPVSRQRVGVHRAEGDQRGKRDMQTLEATRFTSGRMFCVAGTDRPEQPPHSVQCSRVWRTDGRILLPGPPPFPSTGNALFPTATRCSEVH